MAISDCCCLLTPPSFLKTVNTFHTPINLWWMLTPIQSDALCFAASEISTFYLHRQQLDLILILHHKTQLAPSPSHKW